MDPLLARSKLTRVSFMQAISASGTRSKVSSIMNAPNQRFLRFIATLLSILDDFYFRICESFESEDLKGIASSSSKRLFSYSRRFGFDIEIVFKAIEVFIEM